MDVDGRIDSLVEDTRQNKDLEIDFRQIIEKYLYHWKSILFCTILGIILGFVYLKMTPDSYLVSTTILLEDKDSGVLSSEMSALQDMSMFGGTKKSMENEIGIIRSFSLMNNVIKDLEINIMYFKKGEFINDELYKEGFPFVINFFVQDSIFNGLNEKYIFKAISKTEYIIEREEEEEKSYFLKKGVFGKNMELEYGKINVVPRSPENIQINENFLIVISPIDIMVNNYRRRIKISEPESIKSTLLNLSLEDRVKKKAEDILNNIVYRYNKDGVDYKTSLTESTDVFINDRISEISIDLKDIDLGVQDFKTKNRLTNMTYEAEVVLDNNAKVQQSIIDFTTQIQLIDYIFDYMDSNPDKLIPNNLGLTDASASQSTVVYNQLIIERNRIIQGSSLKNPTVVNLDSQLSTLRSGIKQSLNTLRSSLVFSLNEAQQQENKFNAQRSRAPQQEREFQDIKRKQLIVESLYLYLLQKREENAISLGVSAPNAKVVDFAFGSDRPVSPNKKMTLVLGMLLGFIFPVLIISIHSMLDNKIHFIEDIEGKITAPILGDIPSSKGKNKIVITEKSNDDVSEAFRLIRSNLHFMLSNLAEKPKTIFISSSIAGEGKTFISLNLAASLALLNKNVILIGADIRKPKITEYLKVASNAGLTNYLVDPNTHINDIIYYNEDCKFDLIEAGIVPPNPSELLLNGRFDHLISYCKEKYDYILVDTSPVNLVTDTLLLSHYADLFIYVIRANYLDKRLLKSINKLFVNKRLPNMALLVNDINYKKRGYGYGYGYGGVKDKKPWWKIF